LQYTFVAILVVIFPQMLWSMGRAIGGAFIPLPEREEREITERGAAPASEAARVPSEVSGPARDEAGQIAALIRQGRTDGHQPGWSIRYDFDYRTAEAIGRIEAIAALVEGGALSGRD
jgi:hypothetical protein